MRGFDLNLHRRVLHAVADRSDGGRSRRSARHIILDIMYEAVDEGLDVLRGTKLVFPEEDVSFNCFFCSLKLEKVADYMQRLTDPANRSEQEISMLLDSLTVRKIMYAMLYADDQPDEYRPEQERRLKAVESEIDLYRDVLQSTVQVRHNRASPCNSCSAMHRRCYDFDRVRLAVHEIGTRPELEHFSRTETARLRADVREAEKKLRNQQRV
jgi:hypothetical protein